MTQYPFGATGINRFAYDVLFILEAKHGSRLGESYWHPLVRFINRAATPKVKKLLTMEPGKIAAVLEKGGSVDDAYRRIERMTA